MFDNRWSAKALTMAFPDSTRPHHVMITTLPSLTANQRVMALDCSSDDGSYDEDHVTRETIKNRQSSSDLSTPGFSPVTECQDEQSRDTTLGMDPARESPRQEVEAVDDAAPQYHKLALHPETMVAMDVACARKPSMFVKSSCSRKGASLRQHSSSRVYVDDTLGNDDDEVDSSGAYSVYEAAGTESLSEASEGEIGITGYDKSRTRAFSTNARRLPHAEISVEQAPSSIARERIQSEQQTRESLDLNNPQVIIAASRVVSRHFGILRPRLTYP